MKGDVEKLNPRLSIECGMMLFSLNLKKMGIRGRILKWIRSYLKGRLQ